MPSRRSLAVAWCGMRLLASDPAPMLVTVLMPIVMIAFLMPSARAQLRAAGFAQASGAEQLVPGLAVMFAFMSTTLVGTLFYREHAWGTWDRLRASSASTFELVIGKVAPLYVCLMGQMAAVFAAGRLFYGYQPNGSPAALALLTAALVATLVSFGVMLVALFATMDQALVVGNLGGIVMSGLGGAFAPATTLPAWAQYLAHGTPTYWAMRGLSDISLKHAGLAQVAGPTAMLLVFSALFAAVAAFRFKPANPKAGTT